LFSQQIRNYEREKLKSPKSSFQKNVTYPVILLCIEVRAPTQDGGMLMDDAKIIDLYWIRSERAIAETAKKYGNYCRSIAFRILRNDQDSEECVNDTWLGAWSSMPPKRPAVLSTFLGRITRNLSLNRWKQYNAEKRGSGEMAVALEELRECVPAPDGVESSLDDMALADALSRFLLSLSLESQKFFVQRYWYLCSIQKIASNCGVGSSKVKMSLLRSRQDLQTFLQKEGIAL